MKTMYAFTTAGLKRSHFGSYEITSSGIKKRSHSSRLALQEVPRFLVELEG
jgi:hypothetical protein